MSGEKAREDQPVVVVVVVVAMGAGASVAVPPGAEAEPVRSQRPSRTSAGSILIGALDHSRWVTQATRGPYHECDR